MYYLLKKKQFSAPLTLLGKQAEKIQAFTDIGASLILRIINTLVR
jgi:hypothetical protein